VRPLIVLPSRFTVQADSWRVQATALGLPYQAAIVRAGGQPVAVPPLYDEADAFEAALELLSHADGVCLPGGPDIDPRIYGAPSVHADVYGVRAEHDTLDVALARAAVALERPVLAICRGCQVLNVALGGTLHQHLADLVGPERAAAHSRNRHDIELVPGSKIAGAIGAHTARSHCVHHQALDALGVGLAVTAWCDGVVEAVELADRWVLGVQWHPEDDAASDPRQQAVFDAFVRAAASPVPAGAH
jgi:putative glutamine amidotransferase